MGLAVSGTDAHGGVVPFVAAACKQYISPVRTPAIVELCAEPHQSLYGNLPSAVDILVRFDGVCADRADVVGGTGPGIGGARVAAVNEGDVAKVGQAHAVVGGQDTVALGTCSMRVWP